MKKNFLNSLFIVGNLKVYEEYSFKKGTSFIENGFTVPEDETALFRVTGKMINKFLPDDFFNEPLYGKNKKGKIEKVEYEWKEFDNKPVKVYDEEKYEEVFTYLIANRTISDPYIDIEFARNFKEQTNKYELEKFGKTFYTELGKTDFSSFDNLVSFVGTWGLPTGISCNDFPRLYLQSDINIIFMSIDKFYSKISEYQRIFKLFNAISLNDFDDIEIGDYAEFPKDVETKILFGSEMQEKSIFSFRLDADRNSNSFKPVTVFDDMFDFAYYFLNMAMYSDVEMRKCEHCNHIFEITHNRQRFCPPLPGRKRSSCEMAFNNRIKKDKKKALKLALDGYAAQQIANELGRELDEINEWIKEKA